MYSGKRDVRFRLPKQIRADEDMVRKIQLLADGDVRDFPREVIYLLQLGIFHKEHCLDKAHEVTSSHSESRPGLLRAKSHSGKEKIA